MPRTRTTAAVLLALSMAAPLSACSVGGESSSSPGGDKNAQEITFLTFETPNLPPSYWDAAIKRITAKYPDIKVKKLVSPSADRTAYAKQLRASGQLPDVMIAVSPSGFAEAGDLYAWQPGELKDFLVPDGGAINGKVYQLPTNTQTIPDVYYRKSMFAAAGITTPPRTYAELLADCARLKAEGTTPFVVGGGKDAFPSVLPLTGTVATDVYRKDPDWMLKRRSGQVKFAAPDFTGALRKVGDLARKGYIDSKMVSLDYAATEQAFLKGKGAMYPMGSWFAAAGDKSPIKNDIGVFAWPTDDGSELLSQYTGGGLDVNARSKHLDAARKFALAFQLDKTNLDASVRSDALFPAIKGYTPPSDMGPVFTETYDLWTRAVKDRTTVKAFAWETGGDALLPGVDAKVFAAAQDVILGRKSPGSAAAYLDTEWKKAS
ncbi:extracellular solute-binding protein [Streptomyces cocklensis]|uniref:ABC transporter substrate-binding protein n=1 Tax=Actinacidiphila cocklensis TaxID=887465 RepID=A0A9W4DM24_9ACTN|nr:extracellular solute-binding protein [Actinacidiphila cocklensis]MDD1062657.1 extracellular solute-binding protein [Actinacidiphila cocklensis]CAG6392133.1 ABC transporter substrate-binding protein [Actinacidiphila cocklensis]